MDRERLIKILHEFADARFRATHWTPSTGLVNTLSVDVDEALDAIEAEVQLHLINIYQGVSDRAGLVAVIERLTQRVGEIEKGDGGQDGAAVWGLWNTGEKRFAKFVYPTRESADQEIVDWKKAGSRHIWEARPLFSQLPTPASEK